MAGDNRKEGWRFLHYVIHHEGGAKYKWQAWIFSTERIGEYVEEQHQDPADYRGKQCARIWGWATAEDKVLILGGYQEISPDTMTPQAVAKMRNRLSDWDKTPYVVKQKDLNLSQKKIWDANGNRLSAEELPEDVRNAMEQVWPPQ